MADAEQPEGLAEVPPKKPKALTNKALQKNVEAMGEQLDAVTEAVNQLGESQVEITTSLDNISKTFTSAINAGVAPKKMFEPMEQDQGTERAPSEFKVERDTGDANLVEAGIFDVDSPQFNDKMKLLAFMEEPVEVYIQQTSDKDADMLFDIQVNGMAQIFHRDQTVVVKRYFVEGLARAKPVHYVNEPYAMANGDRGVRYPSRRGLRYPFTVMKDPNPQGQGWLKAVLAQG